MKKFLHACLKTKGIKIQQKLRDGDSKFVDLTPSYLIKIATNKLLFTNIMVISYCLFL